MAAAGRLVGRGRPRHPVVGGPAGRTATDLRSHLPGVVDAVLDGRVTPEAAAVLTRLIGPVDPQSLTDAEPQRIALAGLLDPAELARQVRKLLATHGEPQLDADQATARVRAT